MRDTVLLPGAALVELALYAGRELGCGRLDELTIERPVVLDPPRPERSNWPSRPRTPPARAASVCTPRPTTGPGPATPPAPSRPRSRARP
ncbi:hypothetical protein NKH77_01370 [Streptomyces sp. M19]